MSTSEAVPPLGTARQPIVKAAGTARRAQLLPAPNTDPNPHPPVLREEGGVASVGSLPGANDARLRQDRPPHW
ncbi:hypothetical protein RCH23_002659 [Cryobacterium sp. CAN_C3]|uniref:hypothetical protein n=1 Tax=unclassified Cryobacterium TaxID=2649013 RepID=UPI0018CADE12|nr:hypothetical protein [Cryobacterium sp. CAN_C3]MEC5155264.1 hypothetical protein [Cryobacterium sp. CAN_C3]